MWDVIVLIPDHCLSIYFVNKTINSSDILYYWKSLKVRLGSLTWNMILFILYYIVEFNVLYQKM